MKDNEWIHFTIVITLIIAIVFFVSLKDKMTINTNGYKEYKVVELRKSNCIKEEGE